MSTNLISNEKEIMKFQKAHQILIDSDHNNKFFDEVENTFFFQFHRINKSIIGMAAKYIDELDLELNPTQLHVLMTIYNQEGLSQQDLSEILFRDKSSIQRTMQSFLKKDLIFFIQDPKDGRKKIVRTTEKGEVIGKQIKSVLNQIEREIQQLLQKDGNYANHINSIATIASLLNE